MITGLRFFSSFFLICSIFFFLEKSCISFFISFEERFDLIAIFKEISVIVLSSLLILSIDQSTSQLIYSFLAKVFSFRRKESDVNKIDVFLYVNVMRFFNCYFFYIIVFSSFCHFQSFHVLNIFLIYSSFAIMNCRV